MTQVTITVPAAEARRPGFYTRIHEGAAMVLGTSGDLVDLTHEESKDDGNMTMTFEAAVALTLVGAA